MLSSAHQVNQVMREAVRDESDESYDTWLKTNTTSCTCLDDLDDMMEQETCKACDRAVAEGLLRPYGYYKGVRAVAPDWGKPDLLLRLLESGLPEGVAGVRAAISACHARRGVWPPRETDEFLPIEQSMVRGRSFTADDTVLGVLRAEPFFTNSIEYLLGLMVQPTVALSEQYFQNPRTFVGPAPPVVGREDGRVRLLPEEVRRANRPMPPAGVPLRPCRESAKALQALDAARLRKEQYAKQEAAKKAAKKARSAAAAQQAAAQQRADQQRATAAAEEAEQTRKRETKTPKKRQLSPTASAPLSAAEQHRHEKAKKQATKAKKRATKPKKK
jgi:hypothetical protein